MIMAYPYDPSQYAQPPFQQQPANPVLINPAANPQQPIHQQAGSPPTQPQNPQNNAQNLPSLPGANPDIARSTLWMGELDPWMDENWLRQLWYSYGEEVSVKMIRDKFTHMPAGYCFITFTSPAVAMKILSQFNGSPIPNTHKFFKLNWSSGGNMNKDRPAEFSIFVGDLAPEVNDYLLLSTFQQRYPSCKSAKVVTDPNSGMSRGYGFVRFGEESEQQRALTEMNGQFCGSRAIRVSTATPKSKQNAMGGFSGHSSMGNVNFPNQNQFNDPNNTTVFVGGLNSSVNEEELRTFFQPFGEIVNVKIPPNKGCGFVQYLNRQSAELAIQQMNGSQIGTSKVRLSWGRSQNDKRNIMGGPSGNAVGYRPQFHPSHFPYGAHPFPHAAQHLMQPHAHAQAQRPPYHPHNPSGLDPSKMNNVGGIRDGLLERGPAPDGSGYNPANGGGNAGGNGEWKTGKEISVGQ
ncbi:hypothetical protein BKA69DRAFT_58162 [Paraphysoderma sedebokerense]|nr:hypothetical protein BKA69DRAFT_58162 [Paraphysoderma sedebokerense]